MGGFKRDNKFGGGFRGKKSFGGRDFGGRGNRFNKSGGKPTMHQAVCSKCGEDCEVPFRPTSDRPIFCSNCFVKPTGNDRGGDRFGKGNFSRPSYDNKKMFQAVCDKCGANCELPFQPRSDKPVLCSNCFVKKRDDHKDNSAGITQKLDLIENKLDLILKSMSISPAKDTAKKDLEKKPKTKKTAKKETLPKAKKAVKKKAKK